MTIAIYRSVQEEAENAHQAKRRFSVSGVLSELDVSSSGYYAWAVHKPSKQAQHREEMKEKIQTIYNDSMFTICGRSLYDQPRTFCRTVRRVTRTGKVKCLRHGAEATASLNWAMSQYE